MLQLRKGVDPYKINWAAWYALGVAYALHSLYMKPEMVITDVRREQADSESGDPGTTVLKLRTVDLTEFDAKHWQSVVAKNLTPLGYAVHLELQHLRIECPRVQAKELYQVVE